MAHKETTKLDAGVAFPDFQVNVLDSGAASVKALLAGSWSVLLLYRGHW